MNFKYFKSFSILISFALILFSCSPTESVFEDHQLTLTVDAEVTESWITLQTNSLKKSATFFVLRDTTVVFEGRLDKADTLIHDEGLEPSTIYNYSSYAKKGSEKSEMVESFATTMDTTNYNFDITEHYIDYGVFNDCWIWDKNNFWVTGHYYKRDSLGQLIGPFTILSFENDKWIDIEVKYQGSFTNPLPLKSKYQKS